MLPIMERQTVVKFSASNSLPDNNYSSFSISGPKPGNWYIMVATVRNGEQQVMENLSNDPTRCWSSSYFHRWKSFALPRLWALLNTSWRRTSSPSSPSTTTTRISGPSTQSKVSKLTGGKVFIWKVLCKPNLQILCPLWCLDSPADCYKMQLKSAGPWPNIWARSDQLSHTHTNK